MRTTLKRGIGRAAALNGNGKATLPPGPLGAFTVYRQPEPPQRSKGSLALRIVGWAALVLATVVSGVAGGAYLYAHETVAAIAPKDARVKKAAEKLNVALPGQPATALVIGYDRRAGEAKGTPSRSDTLMLLRADPDGKTISMLPFPRDLSAEIRCPGRTPFTDKINSAYSHCGPQGTLETVKALTGLPINYLITVNFRGFRQLVDKLGGIWLDVDRRYYNSQGGDCGGCYATINLQPGYQRLTGYKALDYVRFRHTDSDIHRNARQQQFVKALKDQLADISATRILRVVKVITGNVEVAQGGGKNVSLGTVKSYALLALSLPPGNVFQNRIEGLEDFGLLTTAPENISSAVRRFTHPDVEAPQKATAVALKEKVKTKVLPAKETTVIVLNGNGITGAAANANYLLSQRGYAMVLPADGISADAPNFGFFRTVVFFNPRKDGAKQAAQRVANLFGSADVKRVTAPIRRLSNGAMLTAVVGQTFHNTLAAAPVDQTPQRAKADVTYGASASRDVLAERRRRVKFPLMVPTVVERSSWIDRERPVRLYRIDPDRKHKAIRLVFRMGGSNEYWGVQETSWEKAPALDGKNFVRNIGGRRYELYYNGPHLHMVVLRTRRASYWVVNTLLDRLSNETMIAIAKGLRPLSKVKS
jgi:LCP family protein required for cell wall assembly